MATVLEGKLQRNTTASEVARVLRDRILAGHYSEDEFIRQELIAQELGVSRIPVREALAQLEAEGFVIREKYRGAVVPKLSVSEIEEIYELRLMLEPHLLRAAIAKITPEVIEELNAIIIRSHDAEDMSVWASLNMDFHRTMYKVAAKPLSLQMLDNLLMRADRYLKMQRFLSPETQHESDAEHQRILELIRTRDANGAVEALISHIRWNRQDVARMISSRE